MHTAPVLTKRTLGPECTQEAVNAATDSTHQESHMILVSCS